MSQIAASAPPLLLHLQFPADPGLVAVLRHCAPDARVESAAFRLEDWRFGHEVRALNPGPGQVPLGLPKAAPEYAETVKAAGERILEIKEMERFIDAAPEGGS